MYALNFHPDLFSSTKTCTMVHQERPLHSTYSPIKLNTEKSILHQKKSKTSLQKILRDGEGKIIINTLMP